MFARLIFAKFVNTLTLLVPGGGGFRHDGEFIVITFVWQNIWSWNYVTFNIILYHTCSKKKNLEKIFQSRGIIQILEGPKFQKKKKKNVFFTFYLKLFNRYGN